MKECEFMAQCIDRCALNNIYVLHINNEEGTASRRALGMRKGVPDLILIGESVVFAELKRDKSLKPSEAQRFMIETLNRNGVFAACYGDAQTFSEALTKAKTPHSVKQGKYIKWGDKAGSEMVRVSKWYREQVSRDPYVVFGLKLFSNDDNKFPWMIDIEKHLFVATHRSKVTQRLLNIGWDVVLL